MKWEVTSHVTSQTQCWNLNSQQLARNALLCRFVKLLPTTRRAFNELERQLWKLMALYPGTQKIPWAQHPEESKAFYRLRTAVGECPRLFFYDSHMPVVVNTDACNGGIGGYVFQRDADGLEKNSWAEVTCSRRTQCCEIFLTENPCVLDEQVKELAVLEKSSCSRRTSC